MRLIDADELKKAIKKELPQMSNWGETFIPSLIDNAPTVESTFSREELKAWLYANAANNLDGNKRDQLFADDCEEIIKRLDGFERFVKDRREGKI